MSKFSWETFFRKELNQMTPYEAGLRVEDVQKQVGAHTQVCKLSSNEGAFAPSDHVRDAIINAIDCLNEYPDGSQRELRQKISDMHGIKKEELFFGNGSNELLMLMGIAALQPGDEVVFAWPSFVVYDFLALQMGAKSVRVKLNDKAQIDTEAIIEAITPKTKFVFICNPNNPTATALSKEQLDEFMNNVPDHVCVVFDEAYIEFADEDATVSGLTYFDGKKPVIILKTFSKAYGLAGLRVGYGVAPAEFVQAIDKVRTPFNVTTLALAGAYAALEDTKSLELHIKNNKIQRDTIQNTLDELGIWHSDSQTNFVYARIGNATTCFNELLSKGIISRVTSDPEMIRISIGTKEQTDILVRALKDIFSEGIF